ncbi:hypothetical protein L1987_50051 [Smallanthus sonchifolius]|uniref:Uncharacterized protein n=1 Tax=Smallanthus sonchifolius TaxID=185202 RepID=A0ACB9FWE0_9ASTR|nr:hypothetical protein L1987_50051 [Smallanthus sonchifolius]
MHHRFTIDSQQWGVGNHLFSLKVELRASVFEAIEEEDKAIEKGEGCWVAAIITQSNFMLPFQVRYVVLKFEAYAPILIDSPDRFADSKIKFTKHPHLRFG